MIEVDSSYVLEGDKEAIMAHLTPRRVAEFMGYTIREADGSESGQHLRVQKYDTEFTLAVQETKNGYEFSQYGSEGPFRVLDGNLRVEGAGDVTEEEASRVVVDIAYTMESAFSFLVDRLARRIVQRDADTLLDNLAMELAEERDETEEETDGEAESEGEATGSENLATEELDDERERAGLTRNDSATEGSEDN